MNTNSWVGELLRKALKGWMELNFGMGGELGIECSMELIGKMLVVMGVGILVIGVVVWALGRAGFKGLPGDISYQGQHGAFYFPVVTCIVLSVLATVGMWVWQWLSKR